MLVLHWSAYSEDFNKQEGNLDFNWNTQKIHRVTYEGFYLKISIFNAFEDRSYRLKPTYLNKQKWKTYSMQCQSNGYTAYEQFLSVHYIENTFSCKSNRFNKHTKEAGYFLLLQLSLPFLCTRTI